MVHSFYCKRCGESKSFDTKEERNKYKERHRPKVSAPVTFGTISLHKTFRAYACDFVPIINNGISILRRRSAF